jgi:hypothetical protein
MPAVLRRLQICKSLSRALDLGDCNIQDPPILGSRIIQKPLIYAVSKVLEPPELAA